MTSPLVAILVLLQAFKLPAPESLPPYVPPLTVLDGVLHLPPAEPPVVQAAAVCYGPAAHLRLTLALQMAPALSDERSRLAWLSGWSVGGDEASKATDVERVKRIAAEDKATAATARLEVSDWPLRWLLTLGGLVFVVGAAVGFAVHP